MVTINSGVPLTFPRAYITGFAIFRENISARFEGLTLVINDEDLGVDITLNVNRKVYPARSVSCFLDEVFEGASAVEVATGLPTALDINVWVDIPPTYSDFAICLSYAELIEPPTFLNLPDMPTSYWHPVST